MNETFIHLDLLDPNPYQPRQHEDSAVVQELAENILRNATVDFDGLLQAPTVRAIGGDRYQLAFGHTRKAAFAYLYSQGHERYNIMRVFVRDMSDVQMFEAAVAENIKRRDLNPIEQAESMRRYMDEFGKTSVEAGEFFNCSEENVRAKVRLLNLPTVAQEELRAGNINETAARSLMTLARILPNNEKKLQQALEEIKDGEKPEDVVGNELRYSNDTKIIQSGNFPINQKNFKYLSPAIEYDALKVALGIQDNKKAQHILSEYLTYIEAAKHPDDYDVALQKSHAQKRLDELEALVPGMQAKLQHLSKPPACTACAHFAQIDHTDICGLIPCFERKVVAQQQNVLHDISEKTGIAVWTKEDGASTELQTYNDKHRVAWNKKVTDLRLKIGGHRYNNFEPIPNWIAVVAVGKTYETWKKANEQSKKDKGESSDNIPFNWKRERQIQEIRERQVALFAWETVAPLFTSLLESIKSIDFLVHIDNELVNSLEDDGIVDEFDAEDESVSKPKRLAALRKYIVYKMVVDAAGYNTSLKTCVTAFAQNVQGTAELWGVKLPKGFLDKAAEHDEAVKLAVAELDKKDGDE